MKNRFLLHLGWILTLGFRQTPCHSEGAVVATEESLISAVETLRSAQGDIFEMTCSNLLACIIARHGNIARDGLIKTHIIQVWIPEHICLTEFLNDPFA